MAAVKLNEKWGFINEKGQEIIPIKYDYVWDFNEDIGAGRINEKNGCFDKQGNIIIDFKYDGLYGFSDGLAYALLDGKIGFVDKNENIIIPFDFDAGIIGEFNNGLTFVCKNNKYALINKEGLLLTDFKYDQIFIDDSDAILFNINNKMGWMNKNGKEVMPAKYSYIAPFKEDKTFVNWNGKYAYFNINGEKLTSFKYDSVSEFNNGISIAKVYDNKTRIYSTFIINKFGNEILNNNILSSFNNGKALISQKDFSTHSIKKLGIMEIPKDYEIDKGQNELIKIYINENYLFLYDQDPIIENQRVLVPMRAIFEALGSTVSWDNIKREVSGTYNGVKVNLIIDSKDAIINGQIHNLDTPARIINGRTMVPIRFVAESFGCNVSWDPATRSVKIW